MENQWWNEDNLRLVQNNLRASDASMDFDSLLERLDELSANVWMMNTGGIAAFYPTQLDHHYSNPHLEHDLLDEAVEKCHNNGIKLISRFDFSKVHEYIHEENPDWAYRDQDGGIVNYNDYVHTCVNSYYQHEYSLDIIEEVLLNYDIDGIFFNMFGYQEYDYSGNYHGPCHCENCQQRFKQMYDAELPEKGYDESHPQYHNYMEFREITTSEIIDDIQGMVKELDDSVAIYTYTDYQVDIVSNESNTAVDRTRPKWHYKTSDNVKSIESTYDKIISDISINAVDIPYRYMGVSKHEIKTRLYESIASGSGLAFCINGIFDDYPDRSNFQAVSDVYEFHKEHEEYFGDFSSVAEIGLLKPNGFRNEPEQNGTLEYRGIFRMLKEDHKLFDVITERSIQSDEADLSSYDALILPGMEALGTDIIEPLSQAQESGATIIATGSSLIDNGPDVLEDIFSASVQKPIGNTRGSYVEAEDDDLFYDLRDTDWIFIDGEFHCVSFEEDVETYLTYITPGTFGPPERVSHEGNVRSTYSGAGLKRKAGETSIYMPWSVGRLYYKHGYKPHKKAFIDLLEDVSNREPKLETDASEDVEVFFNKTGEDQYILQYINHSGFNGTSYNRPTPVSDITTMLKGIGGSSAFSLVNNIDINLAVDNMDTTITTDELSVYESIVIE